MAAEIGQRFVDFRLQNQDGKDTTLGDFAGKWLVVYVYPKDDTPGCTTEACGFRDVYSEFEQRGAVVLGVSPDDEASHTKFREKYSLPFTLLADPEHKAAENYGVWVEKNYAGRKYMGVARSTFVIDTDGNIVKAMHNVKPDGHPQQVLDALP